jgi:hypothetical protein
MALVHKKPTLQWYEIHQLKVARSVLRANDTMANVMGGMTKAEARQFIAKLVREGKIKK